MSFECELDGSSGGDGDGGITKKINKLCGSRGSRAICDIVGMRCIVSRASGIYTCIWVASAFRLCSGSCSCIRADKLILICCVVLAFHHHQPHVWHTICAAYLHTHAKSTWTLDAFSRATALSSLCSLVHQSAEQCKSLSMWCSRVAQNAALIWCHSNGVRDEGVNGPSHRNACSTILHAVCVCCEIVMLVFSLLTFLLIRLSEKHMNGWFWLCIRREAVLTTHIYTNVDRFFCFRSFFFHSWNSMPTGTSHHRHSALCNRKRCVCLLFQAKQQILCTVNYKSLNLYVNWN